MLFAIYYPYYKEKSGMTESAHNPFFIQPLPKLILLPNALSDSIIKFATYHPYYKYIFISNQNQTFVYIASCLYFRYWLDNWSSLDNFLTTSLFAYDGEVCTAKPGLVRKNREPPKTFLHITHPDQHPSLLLSLTLKNTLSNVCMLGNSEDAIICKWPFNLITNQIQQSINKKKVNK